MSLDSYDVIRELGRGGMAVVHLARQRDLGRLAALKELAGLNADDPSFAERFLRESRVAGSLNTRASSPSMSTSRTAARRSSRWSSWRAARCARSSAS